MTDHRAWQDFRNAIEDALVLLHDRDAPGAAIAAGTEVQASALPSLLAQCRDMVGPPGAGPALPEMRSVHHFACSGGTLISRCIAAMPMTQVLSEVDPLSLMKPGHPFLPTDLIGLVQQGSRPAGPEELVEIFRAGLAALAVAARRSGLHLVLRDHAHGQFCLGASIPDRPTLREMLSGTYALRALVTVRHPLDSYLSLLKNDWLRIEPATLEEYARRYLAFLDRHGDLAMLRYEDFLADPEAAMQRVCAVLALACNPEFRDLFPAIRLSGDSGRRGDEIVPRPRRPVPETVAAEAGESPAYAALCARLDYDPAP